MHSVTSSPSARRSFKSDIDAIIVSGQACQADNGTLPGKSAGLGAWLKTNVSLGATGTAGGFNPATGVIPAAGPGTKRALSEATIRDICGQIYKAGGCRVLRWVGRW